MIANYLKLNKKPNLKELFLLIILLISSILITYSFTSIIKTNLTSFSFNIFDVISIEHWIGVFLAGVFLIALFRPLFLSLLLKIKVIDNYYALFLHIVKYGLLAMPFFILTIMIMLNNQILEIYNFKYENNLKVLLWITFFSFFLIWIAFLGTTIKSSLMKDYSFIKSFAKNLLASILTGLILSGISFPYILDINKYEEAFYNSVLELHVKKNRISTEQKEMFLIKLKENKKERIN
ncbi:hypothetical protein [Aliarcobacter butzleri]|uniref:hypothetical protein n=1 Tax=Aliarcobacter butzleri TaxID=28197 RepID=UPI002B24B863|nr:hypothetical protein [Aliarcobacter butzleri]